MKKANHTAILEFEVIKPANELESTGETLSLSHFGEYCPANSLRGYSLRFLLDNPQHYAITKIRMKGKDFKLDIFRNKNYGFL